MILIALYWIFLALLFFPAGVLVTHALKLTIQNPVLLLLLGMVLLTTGFTCVAFFYKLGAVNLIVWSCVSLLPAIIFRKNSAQYLSNYYKELCVLPFYLKSVLILMLAGALLKSAQYPFVIDNESYYVQSIKWLNGYGFVKGIANLHVFFAQNSCWHVLQAGTNFSFITNRINDINGFLFIICTAYFITEGAKANTPATRYWLGFMPLLSVLLFQFLPAPSPDVPCLLLVPVIYHLFIQSKGFDTDSKTAFILFVFLLIVKITMLPVGLIFLPLLKQKKAFAFMAATGLPLIALWIAKNIITSGYPLYPIALFKTGYSWALPKELFDFMIEANANDGYYDSAHAPAVNTWGVKLSAWIHMGGIAGIINKLTVVLLLAMPFTNTVRKDKKARLIYLSMLINFLVLLFTSPQFRYFLHVTIVSFLFVAAAVYNYLKLGPKVYKSLIITACAFMILLFLNLPLSWLTKNKYHQSAGSVALKQLYRPEVNTKYPNLVFKHCKVGNLDYYSPPNFFFYGTADGPLPCVNTLQVQKFKRELGIIPQLQGTDIKDGFKSVKVGVGNK